MPPKSRHRNRGSRSFLSNHLLRSIARGRSYQTVKSSVSDSDFRSQSSLSCDPNGQYQSTNIDSLRHGISMSSNNSVSTSHHNAGPGVHARIADTTSDGVSRHRKRRRLSWFSNAWSRVSKNGNQSSSMIIPPTTSMSSISKSSISSPVLTSTTNACVANTEKVHCSEVLFPISSPPEFHSQSDNVAGTDGSSTIHGVDHISSWTSSLRNIRGKLGHSRRASTGVLLTSSWSRRTHTRWDPAGSSSVTSRRNARTAVRGKLQQLRERLHVLPGETGNTVVDNVGPVKAKEIQPYQPELASRTPPTPRPTPFLPGLHSDSTADLLRSSLNRSFASAVDKFDLRSSPTLVHYSPSMSTIRKAKTFFDLNKQYDSDGNLSSKSKSTPAEDVEPSVDTPSKWMPEKPRERRERENRDHREGRLPYGRGFQAPMRRTRYDPGRHFFDRRPDPDPLGSHPDVLFFATAPTTSDSERPQTVDKDNINANNDDDDEAHAVQEAPIFSPSTGDLSQYTRTPSPVVKKADSEVIKTRVPQETPTKSNPFKTLRKSVSGFLTKSASKVGLMGNSPTRQTKIQGASQQQNAGVENIKPPDRPTYDHQPFTPSPLRKSSRPDVSNVGQVNRKRATTLPSIAQTPEGKLKPSQSRSPTSTANPERRRGLYPDDFKSMGISPTDPNEPSRK